MNLGYSDRLHLGQINCDAWRLLVLLPRTGLSGPCPHADSNFICAAPFLYLPSSSLMLSVSGYWKVIDCAKVRQEVEVRAPGVWLLPVSEGLSPTLKSVSWELGSVS